MENINELEKFASLINSERKRLGLTQEQLAEKLGITDKAISRWERAENYPDITQLKPLSEIFEITIDELLAGEIKPRLRNNMRMCTHCNQKKRCQKEKWLENGICQNSFHWAAYGIIISSLLVLFVSIYLIANIITGKWTNWQFPIILGVIYATVFFISAMLFSLKDAKKYINN